MYQPEYSYRVLVDGIPVVVPDHHKPYKYWDRDLTRAISRAHELREVNERAIVTIEVSPWAYFLVNDRYTWECPGCEYGECPSVGEYERQAEAWWVDFDLDKIRS